MERKFGEIPDWAKTGPIDGKNYDYRCELHCAERAVKRGHEHPTITLQSAEFAMWHEYLAIHLGRLNWAMNALISGQIVSMTVPEQQPQWFDPSFAATPGYRPVLPRDPYVPEEEAARIRQRFGELLRSMSGKAAPFAGRYFKRHSSDELRARYGRAEEPPAAPAGEAAA